MEVNSIRYGSVCSGIEGASMAWSHLNWKPMWFAEIDKHCSSLLAQKYPHVPNFGDMETIRRGTAEPIDLLVGGTPCQSFSVNGLRKGMDDDRGNLARTYARIVEDFEPRWAIWENVPNVLRTNGGKDFGSIVGALVECGYWWAYRILDARHFGLPQRRKRLFLVGHRGNSAAAFAALFDRGTVFKDGAAVAKARQGSLAGTEGSAIGWTGDTTPKRGQGVVPTLRAQQGGEGVGLCIDAGPRKLTMTEWERLQGLPDGYTECMTSETARRSAIGNGFPVTVMQWIGERIAFIEGLK
jgi:DNA (cytosine-5)-methyltransferase 1